VVSVVDVRRCALPGCDASLPSGRTTYCSNQHTNLARLRKHRAKRRAAQPYAVEGIVCPVDGTVFLVEVFNRRRGRPRRYDCESCEKIARKIRLAMREN
jgi:hypothetical protein